jgi:hypothetical protein
MIERVCREPLAVGDRPQKGSLITGASPVDQIVRMSEISSAFLFELAIES